VSRRPTRAITTLGGVLLLGAAAGCGKKGPPLPPLRPTPGAVTAVAARRVGRHLDLRFTIPTTNTDRTSPAAVARVEVYARSVPAGSPRPAKEQIVLKENLVDVVEVKPPAKSDESAPADTTAAPTSAKPGDDRPGTGDVVTFSEEIPQATPLPLPALKGRAAQVAAGTARPSAPATPPPAAGAAAGTGQASTGAAVTTAGASTAGAAAAASAANPAAAVTPKLETPPPAVPTRYFWIQAVAPHGQTGPPPDLVAVPLVDPPAAPTAPLMDYTEQTLTFTWQPGAEGETFRVYQVDPSGKEKDGRPLNDAPLKNASYQAPVAFDHELCLAARAVDVRGVAAIESDATSPACVTPHDHFAPPAPANLNGLPDNGAIDLRWDPVTAADLAGYLVLRGEGGGETLHELTPAPLAATTFVDSTVRSGVTYVYVVVAVDKATPPNKSEQSNTYTVTIR